MKTASALVLVALAGTAAALTFDRTELGNGLVVLTIEDHALPMVEMRAVMRGGSILDPAGADGLAALTTALLERGTTELSAPALAESVEFIGSNLRTGCTTDECYLDLVALARDWPRALGWLAAMVRTPAFADSEVAKARRETVAELIREQDDPAVIVGKAFARLLYGDHPYAHAPEGRVAPVERLGAAEVREFHRRYFVPNNVFLVVVGDFERAALLAQVEHLFGDWSRAELVLPARRAPVVPARPRVAIINRPEMNQAYIELGHLGIAENDPDAYAVRLMAFALGGSSNSRINVSIRENQGLAYSAYAWFDRRLDPGPFVAEVQTKTESAAQALRSLLAEITTMKANGPTARELAEAQAYYIGHFPLTFDSFDEKVETVERIERFGLGSDYLARYVERIRAVTLEDVRRAAREHLFPDRCTLVIVGPVTRDELGLVDVDWVDIDAR